MRKEETTMPSVSQQPAHASGTFNIGGDLTVFRFGFGTMRLTGEGIWGPPSDKQEALAVLRRALDLGINLLDTADSYGPEVSETLIGEALYPYPRDLVIATKGGYMRTGPNQWVPDGRPQHLREALEGSLQRLRLDQIAIYQFHTPDPKVPFEDSVGVLVELQKAGKIRHIGLSNVTLDELTRAQRIVPIVTVQNHYNLADRVSQGMSAADSERMIDVCARQSIGFIPWAPLTAGELARPGGPLDAIAQRHNAPPSQIALAWLLKRSPAMLPIPGTSSVRHLEENIQGTTIQLSQEEFDTISASSAS
jgi:aryl-alcohol dehydrogenase-like predicted oxidoreductase